MNVKGRIGVETRAQLSPSLRISLYVALNAAVLLLLVIGTAVSTPSNPRFVYLALATALCTSPLLSMERINGKYFLLAVYLAFAYVFFGFGDVMGILLGRTPAGPDGILTGAECVILVSLIGVIAGYHVAARRARQKSPPATATSDWPFAAVVLIGLAFWLIGTASLTYWQVYVIGDRASTTLVKNLASLGQGYTTLFMVGQLIQPLGVMILAYGHAAYRRRFLPIMILAVTFIQVMLGFVADYKSEAILVGMLVIITKIYIDGRIPKTWVICGALFIMLAFPVFQAQRLAVRGEQGRSAADTLSNIWETLQKSINAQERVQSGFGGAEYRVQSFWERASLKGSVELIVQRTGQDVPYQHGATLTPILSAFIPRILWSEKESLPVGQIFNKDFNISVDKDTYISPSHVGEIYWNFGWTGTLLVLPAIGLLLGFIGSRCVAFPQLSLTRMMIMFVTIFAFVVRAEGSIANEYVVWLRSLAVIGILHLAFSRSTIALNALQVQKASSQDPNALGARQATLFPNLLR
jgi:O-antigen polysaccharide polymerase Wzy